MKVSVILSESMNKFLTAEIGFDILSQKQSITNSTIETDKSAGNGNCMNENVTDETVDKIENTTENTNNAEKAQNANQRVTWRSTKSASARESISNILSQKQSITNSTIKADKSAGNGNSMNENVTDKTVGKIENTTENKSD